MRNEFSDFTPHCRWLLDRAERFRFTRLTVLTSGLTEGLKHSVSRDFLNTLKAVRPRKSKSMESMSRIHQAEIVVTAEVHDRDAKPPLKHPRPHRPKRQSSAVSSHSSSFRNHPAYAPSIGSRRDSSVSLVSSTVETAAYLARTSFRRTEAPGGGAGFKVCCWCVQGWVHYRVDNLTVSIYHLPPETQGSQDAHYEGRERPWAQDCRWKGVKVRRHGNICQ